MGGFFYGKTNMSKLLNELRNQRGELLKSAKEITAKASADYGNEDHAKVISINDEVIAIDAKIEVLSTALKQEAAEAEYINVLADNRQQSPDQIRAEMLIVEKIFDNALRVGYENLSADDKQYIADINVKNAMDGSTDEKGKFFIPTEFSKQVIKKVELLGGIRKYATVVTTSVGSPIKFPTFDDGDNEGELLAIGDAANDGPDPVGGEIELGAHKMSTKLIAVDNALIQDTGFNLVEEILTALANRWFRLENRLFTNGTGVNQPKGIVTSAKLGYTTALTNAFTFDDLIELEHSIDPILRAMGAAWSFNDKTLMIIKKLKDLDGNYIWKGATTGGEPSTILG